MTIVKNTTTQTGQEFWRHVDAIAAQMRENSNRIEQLERKVKALEDREQDRVMRDYGGWPWL